MSSSSPSTPYYTEAIALLKALISTPSLSGEEEGTATIIQQLLENHDVITSRQGNNIWCHHATLNTEKPTVLLNSHHDTVPPSDSYTRSPFIPHEEEGKLYGLGSNDAGGPLVSLIATFLHYRDIELPFNLVLAATAEEENSGPNGISHVLPFIGEIDFGIVGEPTRMEMGVAEKGLLVLDCTARGISGHAAREEGKNAIYLALEAIEWFRTYRFEKESSRLGPVKMAATIIAAGTRHNVVPDTCSFTVDVRTTDAYSNQETLDIIREHLDPDVMVSPRSIRLNPSGIDSGHPVLKVARDLGIQTFGSPTLSDQAQMPFPTIKIGPGDSARSHTADEYIELDEIRSGIEGYIQILDRLATLPLPRYSDIINNATGRME